MSVLIDMEMPKSCPCELIGVGYDLYCSFAHGIPARVREYDECCEKETRPDWCPLIGLPPHGRLIDADALEIRKYEKEAYDEVVALHKQKRFDAAYEYYRGYSDGLITASGLVRFAPTIIEAEEGE